MKTVAIAQARMGSTRFPGKVLKEIGGHPVLHWVVRALQHAELVDQVAVATSKLKQDDIIVRFCKKHNIPCYRGSEDDVIARYIGAATHFKADILCRITADCPFIDPAVLDAVIALKSSTKSVYASNTWPPTWPDGLDCEVFDFAALLAANRVVNNPVDRDCVTQFIVRNRYAFPSATLTCPLPDMQKERWVLDTQDDLRLCDAIANHFHDWDKHKPPSYLAIKKLLDSFPNIRAFNAHLPRNERFLAALATDRRPKYAFTNSKREFYRAISTSPLPGQTFSKSFVQFPVGHAPLFLSHGEGGHCFDIDGNRYVDLVGGLLPVVLGYCDPDVDFAIRQQLNNGISLSLATTLEADLTERLKKHIPCAEMAKFGKNGADVTAAAVRLARGVTGRNRILLIEKNYHGWHDWSIASTERNLGVPGAMRLINQRVAPDLNMIEAAIKKSAFKAKANQIAAIIIEPEFRSWAFLTKLKQLCTKHDILLIFDEIISGFRWSMGGYQRFISVTPHLATFGKAMGNGMPISAIVGREDLMRRFAPPDNVFYSGTFFGEALSLAASIATIDKMERENVINHLFVQGNKLLGEMQHARKASGLEEVINISGEGPRVQFGFSNYSLRTVFMKSMIQSGVLVIGSNNLCFAHNAAEITRAANSYAQAFAEIASAIKKGTPVSTSAVPTAGMAGVRS